ncbi:MAG: S1 RNA-binding domain-containing protein [Candidatus Beckwithbacteria bacterium]|nr:S1 RNA-binding domain-containing protein [Candidatus Beckwithbacteria bacterium]
MPAKKKVKKVVKVTKVAKVSKVAKKTVSKREPQTMDELLKQTGYNLKGLKKGQLVEGVITDITKKVILIDIGAKTEGVVTDKEYEAAKEMLANMKVGDKVQAYVGSPESERGQILLSLRQAIMDKRWEVFEQALKTGEVVDVFGLEVNKGGIIVKAKGVRGFVPSSQFGREFLGKLTELQNQSFNVKVIEVDRTKNRLIFSEKAVSEKAALAHQAEALKEVKVGDILEGMVSGIMPFGVFVRANIKKLFLEGLVHISEISWEKVDNPANFFKAGDKIKVKVIGVDAKSSRLNLSVKQLGDDPWLKMAEKYSEGTKVTGEITRLAAYGAFVSLEAGVDGLIHISKIPSEKEFKVGQKIDCFVESVDAFHRRMSLSLALTTKPVGYK